MSNIFQPYTRNNGGVLSLNIGTGALVDPVKSQGLNLDAAGAIYAALDGVINHYNAALPLDVNGRLIVSNAAQTRVDQGIPFTASGAIALGGSIDHYDQSLAFDVESKLSTSVLFTGAFSTAFSTAFDAVST